MQSHPERNKQYLRRGLLQTQWYGHIVYATRTSDGGQVCIKRVVTGSSESRIARMLSAPPLRDDPAIHAVPILDVFQDEENGYITYLVMPLLRHIDDPPIEAVGDVVDFVDQLLEVRVDAEYTGWMYHEQLCASRRA